MEKSDEELRLEANQELMAKIWNEIPKDPTSNNEMVRYTNDDLHYLYETGFVDSKAYKYEEWEKAFESTKQINGTYLFNKEKFISLGRYKYVGPIKTPLDPLKIREGWYDLEVWRNFIVSAIFPSTSVLTMEKLVEGEKKAKAEGKIVNGRIKVDKEYKLMIKMVIDNFPSPRRRRELGVQAAYEKMVQEAASRSVKPISQKTTYEQGQKVTDVKRKKLDETLVKRSQIAASSSAVETVSLKDLSRKSKQKNKKTNA